MIAITTCTHPRGFEFRDPSLSLSLDYAQEVVKAGGMPLAIPNVPLDYSTLVDSVDGLLLTGGGDVETALYGDAPGALRELATFIDPQRDELEMALVRRAVETGLPVLAICRGIQLLNVALGGTLYIDLPTETDSPVVHRASDRPQDGVHRVTVTRSSRLFDITGLETATVNSTHHQAVKDLAAGLVVSATADDGVIEGVEMTGHPFLLGVQFHPERLTVDGANPFSRLIPEFVRICRG